MKELIKRWKAKTPAFFKRVQVLCASVGAVSTAAYTTYSDKLPDVILELLKLGITAGVIGMFIAQFTVQDTKEIEEPKPEGDVQN